MSVITNTSSQRKQEVTCRTPVEDLPTAVTMREAAVLLRRSYWSVQQAVCRGEIPHERCGGKMKLIPRSYFIEKLGKPQVVQR